MRDRAVVFTMFFVVRMRQPGFPECPSPVPYDRLRRPDGTGARACREWPTARPAPPREPAPGPVRCRPTLHPAHLLRCVLVACLGVAAVLGAAVPWAATARRSPGPAAPALPPGPASATPPAGTTAGGTVVQIVAHPDDDLFFMNPDTSRSLATGRALTTVYLTAGESDGVNARRGEPHPPAADKAAYAEARQNGIRAAYAEMATGDRAGPWSRTEIRTAGGGRAELDTLLARPGVGLVWLQLHEAGSINGDRPHSLHGLWDGRVGSLSSQLASGTPVREDFASSRQQVIDTIAGLLGRFRPTCVRIQDPTPGRTATGAYTDHQDHLYGARFAQAALARYAEAPRHPRFGVQTYLGYSTSGLPRTLDPATAAAKLRTLKTYARADGAVRCADPAGCGDRKVAARPAGHGWARTVRHTRGDSTSWLQSGTDGVLWAFSVLDGRLAVWRRAADAAVWTGPRLLPGSGIDGGVTAVHLPDGRIAVLGTRTALGERAADYRRDVVLAVQRRPGGDFRPWVSLGTPERDDTAGTSDISAPAAVVDADGRLTAYVRDSGHRLTARAGRPDGRWGGWTSPGGADLRGDPVVGTASAGRHVVFAATPRSVVAWAGTRPGGRLSGPLRTGLPPTTLALSATPDGSGGVRLWYRVPVTGEVRSARFTAGADGGGRAGRGPVEAVRLSAPVVSVVTSAEVAGSGPVSVGGGQLAARSRTGVLATAPVAPGADPVRTGPGFLVAGAPAAAPGGVAAIGLDGALHWAPSTRRAAPGPASAAMNSTAVHGRHIAGTMYRDRKDARHAGTARSATGTADRTGRPLQLPRSHRDAVAGSGRSAGEGRDLLAVDSASGRPPARHPVARPLAGRRALLHHR